MNARPAPLVSVVIASYNGARFIAAQLESILQQTHPQLEVIVVDDGSTDDTVAVVQSYQEQNPNLRLVVNEKNLGYVKNFEKGLLLSTGDFIAPSDQDDIWKPEKISRLLAEIGDHDIIYCNSELIDTGGSPIGKRLSEIKRLTDFNDPLNFAVGGSAPGHAMLIRRELLARAVPLPTMIPHDYWIAFVGTFDHPIKFLDETLVLYRQHDSNVFGAVKNTGRKKKREPEARTELARERMRLLYEKCPANHPHKEVYRKLHESYKAFSLKNNISRVALFLKHRDTILAFKHRSAFRRWLYCLKMFATLK